MPSSEPEFQKQNTFLRDTSGYFDIAEKHHLHIILTNPVAESGKKEQVLLVTLVSSPNPLPSLSKKSKSQIKREYYDPACRLKKGDHDFIKHDSFILYREAMLEDVDILEKQYESNDLKFHKPMKDVFFNKICKGLGISDHSDRTLISFFDRHKNKPYNENP